MAETSIGVGDATDPRAMMAQRVELAEQQYQARRARQAGPVRAGMNIIESIPGVGGLIGTTRRENFEWQADVQQKVFSSHEIVIRSTNEADVAYLN